MEQVAVEEPAQVAVEEPSQFVPKELAPAVAGSHYPKAAVKKESSSSAAPKKASTPRLDWSESVTKGLLQRVPELVLKQAPQTPPTSVPRRWSAAKSSGNKIVTIPATPGVQKEEIQEPWPEITPTEPLDPIPWVQPTELPEEAGSQLVT